MMLVEDMLHGEVQAESHSRVSSNISTLAQVAAELRKYFQNSHLNISRAGHEGDWALHMFAAKAMLPFFRVARLLRSLNENHR